MRELTFMKATLEGLSEEMAKDRGINGGDNRVGCFAENDLHAHGQRSEDMLLREAEERRVVLQAGEEGSG